MDHASARIHNFLIIFVLIYHPLRCDEVGLDGKKRDPSELRGT
jgi:hypothetical protein